MPQPIRAVPGPHRLELWQGLLHESAVALQQHPRRRHAPRKLVAANRPALLHPAPQHAAPLGVVQDVGCVNRVAHVEQKGPRGAVKVEFDGFGVIVAQEVEDRIRGRIGRDAVEVGGVTVHVGGGGMARVHAGLHSNGRVTVMQAVIFVRITRKHSLTSIVLAWRGMQHSAKERGLNSSRQ